MGAQKTRDGADSKRKPRKRKVRTDVSSSSESDSEIETTKSPSPEPVPKPTKKEKKKKTSKPIQTENELVQADTIMQDADTTPPPVALSTKNPNPPKQDAHATEDFAAVYLRKVAAELADDLDKVREAPDFKASSVPMLIHALKQGESLYSMDEKRRVVGAASS